jgi:hypothetical protein
MNAPGFRPKNNSKPTLVCTVLAFVSVLAASSTQHAKLLPAFGLDIAWISDGPA